MAALLLHFTCLSAAAQKHFLDLLNHYLFASPGRRRQLRRLWHAHADRIASAAAAQDLQTEPRPIETPGVSS
ncbi:hypothetical protein [Stenotrophomonas maltophilia]|uniref:hypothetical protein n=1 Tax=Stenotrophomonas maltophilia TaxID=40324 RepID=UPI0039C3960A